MDQSKDLRFDYRLSRESIEALMTLLRREKTHGWVQHVEVLLVVYWLAHGLSYSVVSRVFDVPKTTVFDIVHRMKAKTLLLRLGLLVGGWELVEGTGSSSLLRDTWEGPSSAEVEASAAVWPWLDNGHEATRLGG
ncbi:hypothetical protein F7725_015916 [Dissostichus mawsoni]|uniref:Uncharacterized protein n=1 Tax=Dissostichus mawsoni TaxID=36200 RepID=A0A7J5YL02_DISMA|nr:hypothetical protein F7725_015916 [Dissostichus mawsoni]